MDTWSHCRLNLALVEEQDDKAAIGRACGNLGNTFYLLGQFDKAVDCHNKVRRLRFIFRSNRLLQRLILAKEFGDKPAMRRAYSNLGNAHVFLGEIDRALDYYRYVNEVTLGKVEHDICWSP
jgi:tetratricopeptide (TPR) repeat protein